MEQDEILPTSRDDVLFDIRFALRKGFKLRPRKREYIEEDFQSWANAVLEHLELSGVRLIRKKPRRDHS